MTKKKNIRSCRVCGCTDDDCSNCIEKTGVACFWVEEDLCSACAASPEENNKEALERLKVFKGVLGKHFNVSQICENQSKP